MAIAANDEYITGKCRYSAMDMNLAVKNLSLKRGEEYLFRKLSFSLTAGQCVLVKGQNGSGKSTLLKILAGLLIPDKGSVSWDGQMISKSDYYEHVAFLGHKNGLKMALTPLENLQHLASLAHTKLTKIDDIMAYLGLDNHQHLSCHQLSQGQLRKVALAAIIVKKKTLWILDEPCNFLDQESIKLIQDLFTQHLAQKGMLVMASHHNYTGNHMMINLSASKAC